MEILTIKELFERNKDEADSIFIHLEEPREVDCVANICWEGNLIDMPEKYSDREIRTISKSLNDEQNGINGYYIEMYAEEMTYEEIHKKLQDVLWEAAALDESITLPEDFDERFIERLKKENDPTFFELIKALENLKV